MKKKVWKSLAIALSACTLLASTAGCANGATGSSTTGSSSQTASDQQGTTAASGSGDIVIGVLEKAVSDPYQTRLNTAMKTELDRLKSEGKISDYVSLNANLDVQTQLNQGDNMIAKKVSVIVMSPVEAGGCAPVVENSKTAGIPLVLVNSQTSNADEATAFVGSNDETAGQMMGNYVLNQLGGKGKAKGNALLLEGTIGNSAQTNRHKGIYETLFAEQGIKQLDSKTANWLRDQAMSITEDWLQKYSEINAIVAENDEMAMGAVNAIKSTNRKDIIVIGCDATSDALTAIKDGTMSATLYQNAVGQGSQAIDIAYQIVSKQHYEKENMVPFEIVTKDNADKYMSK